MRRRRPTSSDRASRSLPANLLLSRTCWTAPMASSKSPLSNFPLVQSIAVGIREMPDAIGAAQVIVHAVDQRGDFSRAISILGSELGVGWRRKREARDARQNRQNKTN